MAALWLPMLMERLGITGAIDRRLPEPFSGVVSLLANPVGVSTQYLSGLPTNSGANNYFIEDLLGGRERQPSSESFGLSDDLYGAAAQPDVYTDSPNTYMEFGPEPPLRNIEDGYYPVELPPVEVYPELSERPEFSEPSGVAAFPSDFGAMDYFDSGDIGGGGGTLYEYNTMDAYRKGGVVMPRQYSQGHWKLI